VRRPGEHGLASGTRLDNEGITVQRREDLAILLEQEAGGKTAEFCRKHGCVKAAHRTVAGYLVAAMFGHSCLVERLLENRGPSRYLARDRPI